MSSSSWRTLKEPQTSGPLADEVVMTHISFRSRFPFTTVCLRLSCLVLAVFVAARLYAADEPKRIGYPESLANAIYKVDPVYPKAALGSKTFSRVEIDAYVETDGSVYSTIIVLGDPKLIHVAEDAVKQWKFRPFEEDGHPIRAIARLIFHMVPPASPRASR